MAQGSQPEYFCSVCQAGFAQGDIDGGLAVKRFEEVLCTEHFREKYPGECENHPGTEAGETCSLYGARVCENCVVELGGEKYCRRCKPAKVGELITGRPASPVVRRVVKRANVPRRRWKPLAVGGAIIESLFRRRRKRVIKDFYEADNPARAARENQLPVEDKVVIAGVLSFFIPLGFVATVFYYLIYLHNVLNGRVKFSKKPHFGLLVGVAGLAFWLVIFYFIMY